MAMELLTPKTRAAPRKQPRQDDDGLDDIRLMPPHLDGLDDILGLHVARVHALVTFRLERDLAPVRLTPKEVSTLWLVNANPGIPQVALARFFGIERSSVNVVIKSLIERGLIFQQQDSADRRVYGLYISDDGQLLLAEAKQIVAEHERWLCEPLSAAKLSELQSSLEALARLKRA
jgi:DNA-binding MarR family transcriptional regulator